MKIRLKFALLLTLLCSTVIGSISASAAENNFIFVPGENVEIVQDKNLDSIQSDPSLAGCTLGIGMADNGLSVVFITRATQTMNEIGVKNVMLQEKTWYGWKDIPISNYYTSSSDMYAGEVIYTAAEKGKTYRAYCTHYAKYGNTELTLYSETGNFVYN